jgi:hypothetical protein
LRHWKGLSVSPPRSNKSKRYRRTKPCVEALYCFSFYPFQSRTRRSATNGFALPTNQTASIRTQW